jgi:hypothetical protein
MSKAMYEAAQTAQASGEPGAVPPETPQGDDDAIDAEFEVKK